MVIEKVKVGIGMEMGESWGRVMKDWDEIVGLVRRVDIMFWD